MQVIVDTSVWSLALRRRVIQRSDVVDGLSRLIEEDRALLLGPVRQEILSGVRHNSQFKRLRNALEAFPDEPITSEDYIQAALITNHCLSNGVTTGAVDALIAAVAIGRELPVVTTDRDFEHMAAHVPLKLYVL